MKKSLFCILSFLLFFFIVGCTDNNQKEKEEEKHEEKISLSKTSYVITEGESIDIEYILENLQEGTRVLLVSKDTSIVNCEGKTIHALCKGETTLELYLSSNQDKKIIINIIVNTKPEEKLEIKIMNKKTQLGLFSKTELISYVSKENEKDNIVWTSSDDTIASITNKGVLETLKEGKVVITLFSTTDETIKDTMEVEVVIDPIILFENFAIENVLVQEVTSFGYNPDTRTQLVIGSVSKYMFGDINIIEKIVPINTNVYTNQVLTEENYKAAESLLKVRPGILHDELKYIVYHDTGNHTPGADALMHANYMVGNDNASNRARSWHYTVDENVIYHHIPDNEVSWQGDSFDAYAKSIGIETCVNYGSNLYKVWQNAGKLMASLLNKYDLNMDAMKQHYDMSGKDCPKTLRNNDLYTYAISMVEAEYLVTQYLKDYVIEFESLSPEYLDDTGLVLSQPKNTTRLAYKVTISKDDYNESKVFYSTIKGSENDDEIKTNTEYMDLAISFDNKVANLTHEITKDDEELINTLLKEYNELSNEIKELVTSYKYLKNKQKELLNLYKVESEIIISSIYINNDKSLGYLGYSYIQLYNLTEKNIDLKNAYLEIGSLKYTFKTEVIIKSKSYLLISFSDMKVSSPNENMNCFPMPDIIINEDIPSDNFTIALSKDASKYYDVVGVGTSQLYEGKVTTFPSDGNALTRISLLDTDSNLRDFEYALPNPINTNNKKVEEYLPDGQYIIFDYNVLKLYNKDVSLDDEYIITSLLEKYNAFSEDEKSLIRNKGILDELKLEIEGLKNPNIKKVNDAIKQIPSRIVNDFTFPNIEGVSYSYSDNEDSSYFDLVTGKYLKLSYEAKLIKITISSGNITEEIIVNFGIANKDDKLIYSTGTVVQAGGKTSEGYGTKETQTKYTGFGNIAIIIDSKVYFIGKDCLINLTKPENGTSLTKTELRPLGGVGFINNIGIVNGVPTEYKGTGALYYNSSEVELTFDLSDTYGRNNSGAYGYFKTVFSPNEDGEYYVSQILPNTGTNESSTNYQFTLKPGEYLWTPHTYETNKDGGTWLMNPGSSAAGGVLIENQLLEIIKYKNEF